MEHDDDVFDYTGDDGKPSGMKQCIGGFGRNAKETLRGILEDLGETDEADEVLETSEWNIDELVRWCRWHNGERKKREAELSAARASIAALIGAEADAQRTVERQLQRIYELEAIVARLPKTADGMPAVPGMEVFHTWGKSTTIGEPFTRFAWDSCYSTEAAALAAKGATNGT